MTKIIVLVLLALVLVAPTPAFSQLTEPELAATKSLALVTGRIHDAVDTVSALAEKDTTDTTKASFSTGLTYLASAHVANVRAIGIFWGINTEPVPFSGRTREQIVAIGYGAEDRVTLQLTNARKALGALAPEAVTDIAGALALLAALDRTLAYRTPWGELPEGHTSHKCVGPHGDCQRALSAFNFAAREYAAATTDYINAYRAGLTDLYSWRLGTRAASQTVSSLVFASARLKGITFTDEDRTQRAFFKVLRVLKNLTKRGPSEDHHMPYFMRAAGTFAGTIILHPGTTEAAKKHLVAAMTNGLTGQGEVWEGTYQIVNFPDCNLARNPDGCSQGQFR